jgi:DNA polymerase III alpha subunit
MSKIDDYGISHVTSEELCTLLHSNPLLDLSDVWVDDPEEFNNSIRSLFYETTQLNKYHPPEFTVEEFDVDNQSRWFMPNSYKKMDIAKWVLDQCRTDAELQRVGQELMMYQDRSLLDLLRFMKYFVDTMRANNVVWGVGRGSSVSSYVLFLLQVHRIDSLYYDLDINEFLK